MVAGRSRHRSSGLTVGALTIVGLGPAGADRLPAVTRALLDDPATTVIVRTLVHPAASDLAAARHIVSCDDLYDTLPDFEAVYAAIVERVLATAASGPTVYAVPGNAAVGERTVSLLQAEAAASGIDVDVVPGESFLDLVFAATGIDPIERGVQVLDGRNLPDPLPLHLPTVVTQVDGPLVLAEVVSILARVLPDTTPVVFLDALGSVDERVISTNLGTVGAEHPGPRTTLVVDPPPAGWHGLVATNRLLRAQCPWDREQTHHSLVAHLVEETYETVEALHRLPAEAPAGDVDHVAYAALEEELGDLLLQVVFHATLAEEAGAFDVETVAEGIRRKLVHRHPHVFGEVAADTADEVRANWDAIKAAENPRASLMDDVPAALPAIERADRMQRRAASVGFDWPDAAPVLAKLDEEVAELVEALEREPRRVADEMGDVLFSVVNLARHLGVGPELALRGAAQRFETRFREVERLAGKQGRRLEEMSLAEMDALWDRAKDAGA
ncbi:MAG TPA: nucleoside triphosphate pyrophosphohydrolase [Acidimicrobiia bacterium]